MLKLPNCLNVTPENRRAIYSDDIMGVLAIENILADNREVVAKPWNKTDGCRLGHRKRLFLRARCDFPFETVAKDTVCHRNIEHHARLLQGTRHQVVAMLRGVGGPHVHSAKKPRTGRVDVNASRGFVVGGALDSADSLGDLARQPRIRLRDMLPSVLTRAGYPKQLPLEATCVHRRETGRLLGHGSPRRYRRSSSSSSKGPRCRLRRVCSS
ncbi:hypothetical protein MTO96_024459 [Rhipicephalus appendiculatus]